MRYRLYLELEDHSHLLGRFAGRFAIHRDRKRSRDLFRPCMGARGCDRPNVQLLDRSKHRGRLYRNNALYASARAACLDLLCAPDHHRIELSAIVSAILALVLDYGAFYAELFRSGIQAVPKDEIDSSRVLGLSYIDCLRFVIVPRAFRTVLPVLISLSVGLFKDSSLISVLGVADLLYQANLVSSETFRPLETLTATAFI